MSGGKPTRERAAISYAEYSDDEFDSPQKAKNKKRLIESDDEKETGKERALQQQGILKFAKRSGPEDTTFVSENRSNPGPKRKIAVNKRRKVYVQRNVFCCYTEGPSI